MDHTTMDIGSRIQQAREQRGLTRQSLSKITKLSTSTIRAIEQNEFDRLPGGMFRLAYIRMVAAEVGLNAEELVSEYKARLARETPEPPPQKAYRDRDGHALVWTWAALIAGACVFGSTWLTSRDGDPVADQLLLSTRAARLETAAPLAMAAVAASAVIDAPMLQLEMRFSGPCWVSLVADGERLIYDLMQAGERTLVEARDAITLRVGDAGAVSYSINGVAGRPLGLDGEAVTLRITSDDRDSL